MVRAKFVVQRIEHHDFGNNWTQHKVVLAPQYDSSIPEDQKYSKATPSGELWMMVDNPAALEQLKPGTAFYLDFTPVEVAQAA